MLARPTLFGFGLLAAALSCVACSKPVILKQTVQVTDVSSGWFDAGVQNGKNKLVPSVTFKLRKNADVNLTSISLNLTFIFIDSQEHADDVYVQSVPFQGAETAPIVVRSKWGYTGDPPQTRAQMLQNGHFRDMEVQIFAKQSSSQWVELQRVKIARQLLTE
ncbi:MAG: hypothetical protein M3P13_03440 [Acidobacteriota bacterium]|nr:hypothetical protein [Acidobacteriota bacterium]